jgi:2-polyprenyl-3-methyl-5-hydroxy-6-metoxy-1,4-benzoquinol methylase
MKKSEFRNYQSTSLLRFKEILSSHEPGACDEQGLPAYTNPNPLMRWLTWKRVEVVLSTIEKYSPLNHVLDFGCGYGVFIPYLQEHSKDITAFDLMIDQLKNLGPAYGWHSIAYESELSVITQKNGSFDMILAIEVMEHVEDLDNTADLFAKLLTQNGHLIVAGPTENWLYKIGRKLAGYSGEYHVRNVYHIRKALEKRFTLKKIATLIPGLPFYEIYDCVVK